MLRQTWPAVGFLLAGNACGPRATDGGFDSANPAAKLYAIEHAGAQRDPAAVPDLIEQLDSDDPAVRLLAGAALEEITGRTYGYDHADPPAARRSAIHRWVDAWESGELSGSPTPVSSLTPKVHDSTHE
jgi:hypothetical protein